MRQLLFIMFLLPMAAVAQERSRPEREAPNELTMQVIMSQRPERFTEEQWAKMMLDPVNIGLYPIRITQAMLDTIDARQLDRRYQYVMVHSIR